MQQLWSPEQVDPNYVHDDNVDVEEMDSDDDEDGALEDE
jgi:hypothetical protein